MLEQLGCFVRSTSYRSTCTVVPLAKGPGQALRPDSPHFCRVWQGPWRGRRVLEHADRAVYAINGALMGSYGAVPVDAVLQVMKLACARSSCRWKRERIFHRPFEELAPAAAAILIRKKKKKDSLAAVPWVALPKCHMEARHCADLDWKWKLIEMAAAQFNDSTACVIPVAAHCENQVNSAISRPAWEAD